MSKNATLSERMKGYEDIYKFKVVPRTVFALRLDGKNFSKYTKNLTKPFDKDFSDAMDQTAIALAEELNPSFLYTQSDEITLIFANTNPESDVIFDGKIQKLVSISAAIATAKFNEVRNNQYIKSLVDRGGDMTSLETLYMELAEEFSFPKQAYFDSRVIPLPNVDEAFNNVLCRQRDATKNSISMAADTVYSHKELTGKNGNEKQEMLFQKGINWNDYPVKFKRGYVIKKFPVQIENSLAPAGFVVRGKWKVDEETPIFSEDRDYLYDLMIQKEILKNENC